MAVSFLRDLRYTRRNSFYKKNKLLGVREGI